MAVNDIIIREAISRLPLNSVVQCKLLSKGVKNMISQPDFAKILFQRDKDTCTQLIYTRFDGSAFKKFHKISLDLITESMTIIPEEVEISGSCNGLILIDFERVECYCVFNPLTREHQLIPYPPGPENTQRVGLAVAYPNLDQYKLVIISNLVENSNLFYRFHILSSQQPGLWREIRMRTNAFLPLSARNPTVYWRDSLYWLRKDGSVLAFDTRGEEPILIDCPEFLDRYDRSYDKILDGQDMWLGIAQGLLTLVCIYRTCIVTAVYYSASRHWRVKRVFHPVDNFILHPVAILNGFPLWIDSKAVSFLVQSQLTLDYDLYEYNTNMQAYEHAALLHRVDIPIFCFHPTLASAHTAPFNNVMADEDQAHIAETLDNIRRFIIEGIVIEEESSSEESSSSSSGEEEEEEASEEEDEEAADAGGEEAEAEGGGEVGEEEEEEIM